MFSSEGCTRNGYHLYGFRYRKDQFADLPRDKFLKALTAEGIGASSGYPPLNKDKFLADTFSKRIPAHIRKAGNTGKNISARWTFRRSICALWFAKARTGHTRP